MRTSAGLLLLMMTVAAPMAGQVVSLENDFIRGQWDADRGVLVSLKDKAVGREFLNFGRRVAEPELDVPPLELALTEKDGRTRRVLSVPSVLHGVWKLADGRTGAIFACIHDQPVEFTFGRKKLVLEPGGAMFVEMGRKPNEE